MMSSVKSVPIYLKRQGFHPRNDEDFGDGGAFPEIHVAQYPLGRSNKPESKILPVTVDAHGNVLFDAIVRRNENSKKIFYSQHSDLIPKILKNLGDVDEEDEELEKETFEETKAALEKIVNAAAKPTNVVKQLGDSKHIKYKPSLQQSSSFNSGAKERIVKVSEIPVDPLDLPNFRRSVYKRVPKASCSSEAVPVLHSPPRAVTIKEQEDWKIPPCVSNWINGKGYTIPLDKRLVADGRVLQEVQISDNFAKLSETLYVGEQKLREAGLMRLSIEREMAMKEKERKEQDLRDLAQKARSERTGSASESVAVPRGDYGYDRQRETEKEEHIQRDGIREERRREREKERRMEDKKSKITRDRDRDVSEKVALGLAFTGGRGGELMYDQRLFNQEKGMDSGFATDDQYNVYDKGLSTAQPTLSTLYRPKKNMDDEMYGNADEQLDNLKNTERFKPDKAFSSASERAGKRHRPVEFDKEEEDSFGIGLWESDMMKCKRRLDNGGTMRGGSSSRDDFGDQDQFQM